MEIGLLLLPGFIPHVISTRRGGAENVENVGVDDFLVRTVIPWGKMDPFECF